MLAASVVFPAPTVVAVAGAPAGVGNQVPDGHQNGSADKCPGDRDTLAEHPHLSSNRDRQKQDQDNAQRRAENGSQHSIGQPPANDGLGQNTNNEGNDQVNKVAQGKTIEDGVAE